MEPQGFPGWLEPRRYVACAKCGYAKARVSRGCRWGSCGRWRCAGRRSTAASTLATEAGAVTTARAVSLPPQSGERNLGRVTVTEAPR